MTAAPDGAGEVQQYGPDGKSNDATQHDGGVIAREDEEAEEPAPSEDLGLRYDEFVTLVRR
jgi:hypothetical protein